MSFSEAPEARCTSEARGAVELVIEARSKDMEGLAVRRSLPVRERRNVGPFVFLDHLGPVSFAAGQGLDVPPHPHIGLATVTYLLEGELQHRDSLGTSVTIRPGDLNWMSAGRGIVHSERTPQPLRARGSTLHALQSWVALPRAHEESEPTFEHVDASRLPRVALPGAALRVIAGRAYGADSPVRVLAGTLYVDARLEPGCELPLPEEHRERAVYVVHGSVEVDGRRFEPGTLVVLRPEARCVSSPAGARALLLGGEPLDGPRQIFWNFVSSSKERIEQAKRDWQERRFPLVPGDETDFVPLPERRPPS